MDKSKFTINLSISLNVNNEQYANDIINSILFLSNAENMHFTSNSILLVDFLKSELKKDCIKDSTRQNRMSTIQWVEKLFTNIRLNDMKIDFVPMFVKKLKKENLSNNTIIKHLHHLRIYIHRAVKQKKLDSTWLANDIFQLKADPHHHTFLTADEVALLSKMDTSLYKSSFQEVHRAFLFACYTGLRFSDIFQLQASHIVKKEKKYWVELRMIKTKTYIQIPIELLYQGKGFLLIRPLLKRRKGKLFHLKNNTESNRILKKICQEVGITKNVSFHVARHTSGTQLLYHGCSLEVVQKLLGHSNVRTTQIYAELTQQTLIKELSAVSW